LAESTVIAPAFTPVVSSGMGCADDVDANSKTPPASNTGKS
jgi:hypothetical protein